MRDFFPISLVRTVPLDPSKNYIFGYHPHGIISVGAWINFATEGSGKMKFITATNFSKLFQGIDLRLMTLQSNFKIPFARELILSLGIVSVSKKSCEYILSKGEGNSMMVKLKLMNRLLLEVLLSHYMLFQVAMIWF